MSSPKQRLQQINQFIRQPSGRAYANAGLSSNAGDDAKVICKVYEHSPGHNVATLSISNKYKLNIINSPLIKELVATAQDLSKDAHLRAVVITSTPTAPGKPPSWIGGADIREMSQMSSYEGAKTFITHVHEACQALRDIPVPVIAAVHGFALGAGLEIMASCDLRIATETSTFGMPEVKIGLPSVVEAAYFPGLIGAGRARRLCYLAENLDAKTAESWGLVEKVVKDEEALREAVDDWVARLVSFGPKCIRAQKQLQQVWERTTPEEAIEAGIEALAESFRDGGKEPRELMGRFLERKR